MKIAPDLAQIDRDELYRGLRAMDAALEGTGDGLLAFDRDYRYIYWNAAMERMTGRSAADLIGARAFDVFPFLLEVGGDKAFAAALAGQSVANQGKKFIVPDTGRSGVYDGFYAPLRTPDGRIVGGTGVIRDLTSRWQDEQRILETETRFRNMADVAPVLLWMSGTDGYCTFFNQTWLSFTGRTMDQEWGVGWAEGVHYEDFQHCMDTFTAAFNRREMFEMEYRLRRADGEYRWVLDRGRPRFSPDGIFLGYIGSCTDITDRKHAEMQLLKAVQDRDDFLAIAAHELRTPLTALQLTLDGLHRSVLKKAEEALHSGRLLRASEVAYNQMHRLASLVNELLDLSRLTSGPVELDIEDMNLSDLTREVVTRMRASLEPNSTTLDLQAPDGIRGRWDPSRLDRVLTNLIGNAIKYGDGKPVEVTVLEDGTDVRIQVRDHGIGIAADDQKRIFERFERAAPTTRYGGFGLGLWISRQIVVALGGTIAVESEVGRGSLFTVRLPRSVGPMDNVVPSQRAAPAEVPQTV